MVMLQTIMISGQKKYQEIILKLCDIEKIETSNLLG